MSVARAPANAPEGPRVAPSPEVRLDAMRYLARKVAHEVNNFLTPVLGYGELLQGHLDAEPKIRGWLGEICKAARRAHAFARQLQAFSGRQDLRFAPLDLNDLVRASLPRIRVRVPEAVDIACLLQPGLPSVEGDVVQLSHVLVTLAEEVGKTRSLHIETSSAWREGYVALCVSAPDALDAPEPAETGFFEPYADPEGQGPRAALTMAAAHGIVLQHGGILEVGGGPKEGRRLTAWLPIL